MKRSNQAPSSSSATTARLNLVNNPISPRSTAPASTIASSFLLWREQCASLSPPRTLRDLKLTPPKRGPSSSLSAAARTNILELLPRTWQVPPTYPVPRRSTSPLSMVAASYLFWRERRASISPALRVRELGGVLLLGGVSGYVWGLLAGRISKELSRLQTAEGGRIH